MSPRDAHLLVGHSPAQEEDSSGAVAPPFDPAAEDIVVRLRRHGGSFNEFPQVLLREAADECDRLRHDIWRHCDIGSELADEVERLRTALRAVRACTDQSWASQIISDALRETKP